MNSEDVEDEMGRDADRWIEAAAAGCERRGVVYNRQVGEGSQGGIGRGAAEAAQTDRRKRYRKLPLRMLGRAEFSGQFMIP
ncbi:MAG: hypothetical protein ACE1ZF_01785, partial [Gemmatimonadales bacterium]